MSKYDPLFRRLNGSKGTVDLRFSDIEKILGFSLPASARKHPAWWSNSGGTHVQSAAWQAAGYKTEDVSVEQQTVRFVPDEAGFGEMKQPKIEHDVGPTPPSVEPKPKHHPAYGALKGMITLLPGVDLTEPSYPDWKKLYGEDK